MKLLIDRLHCTLHVLLCTRILLLFLSISLFSCQPQKNLTYFQGAIPTINIDSAKALRIFPNDILHVNIFTINSEAYPYLSSSTERSSADNRSPYERGYVVSQEGQLRLPLVGDVNVKGLTINEASKEIEARFKQFIDDPIVTVKKLNFRITVLGEVNRPGTFNIQNELLTLPEALGLAGDLNQFADRKTIRIIRQTNRTTTDFFVDLTQASSLNNQSYFIQPDDVIYVQPLARRGLVNISPSITVFTSIITTAVVVLTLILTVNK